MKTWNAAMALAALALAAACAHASANAPMPAALLAAGKAPRDALDPVDDALESSVPTACWVVASPQTLSATPNASARALPTASPPPAGFRGAVDLELTVSGGEAPKVGGAAGWAVGGGGAGPACRWRAWHAGGGARAPLARGPTWARCSQAAARPPRHPPAPSPRLPRPVGSWP